MMRAADFRAAAVSFSLLVAPRLLFPAAAWAQTRYMWQGAGTNGITSTDPNDPNTQWAEPNNWLGGVLPSGGTVRLEWTNPGSVYAASATVDVLLVYPWYYATAALVISDDVVLQVDGQIRIYGSFDGGGVIQTGGSMSADWGTIGSHLWSAQYAQSGGTASFRDGMAVRGPNGSTYQLSGGVLEAKECILEVPSAGMTSWSQMGAVQQ